MKKNISLAVSILAVVFFLRFSESKEVFANQCAPTRIVNQYACRSSSPPSGCRDCGIAGCRRCQWQCAYTFGKVCDPRNSNCGPGEGECIATCQDFCTTGYECVVTSGTVPCDQASCSWTGSIRQCETQSAGSGCSERTETVSYTHLTLPTIYSV